MISKCYITSFESFVFAISNYAYIFIEQMPENGGVIPELVGSIIPLPQGQNKVVTEFVVCMRDMNTHIEYDVYKNMIINQKFSDEIRVKQYYLNDTLNVYRYMNKNNLKTFVIDQTFEEYNKK